MSHYSDIHPLFGELRPVMNIVHTIKAADEIFYGNKQLYTAADELGVSCASDRNAERRKEDLLVQSAGPKIASTSNNAKKDNKHDKSKKQAKKQKQKSQLQAALEDAKKAVDDEISRLSKGVNEFPLPSNNNVTDTDTEIAKLRQAVAQLTEDLADMKHQLRVVLNHLDLSAKL